MTLELNDGTLRKAAMLAATKGMPLTAFLEYQLDELVAANDRYERAKASVATMFPEIGEESDAQRFMDRWRDGRG